MEVITLCGSMNQNSLFDFLCVYKYLTEQGKLVFLPYLDFPDSDKVMTSKTQSELLHIHFQKISNSNGIMVLDFNGYIGDATKEEMEYAERNGKFIWYAKDYDHGKLSEIILNNRLYVNQAVNYDIMGMFFVSHKMPETKEKIIEKMKEVYKIYD